jgi:DNA-binding MarR family transcriptional regulator
MSSKSLTPSKQRLRLWLRLLKASRHIEGALRERVRSEFGTTLPRFDVLAALHKSDEGLTMGQLSQALMVSNGNVTGLVDRLADEGAVERQSVAGDRRSARVALTELGRADFERMAAVHEEWVTDLLSVLDDSEVAQASSLLARIKGDAT